MAEVKSTAGLGQLHTLFNVGTLGGQTDQELLDRFVSRRDEDAFAALLHRHAPMVLRVCGAVLRDSHDAEDASQATFLILARKAASIRSRGSIGSWLFGVARRVAARARTDLARRRESEQRGGEMTARRVEDRASSEDWAEVCDELERLPEQYRAPIVLCDLEGLTHEQAAAQLHQSARTFRRRLGRGREMLRARLAHRGLIHVDRSLGVGLAPAAARGAVPSAWASTTVRAAMQITSGQATTLATSARVASWVEGVTRTMFLTKLKAAMQLVLILGLIGTGAGVFARNLWEGSEDQGPATEPPTAPARPITVATDPQQVIGRITDHIKDNYARLRAVSVILQTTSLDRSVTKREEVTTKLPNGGMARVVRQPSSVRRERVLLSGDDVLREAMEEDGNIWALHGGVWTQYLPKLNTAWLRLPEQMPGMPPLDPRNIASMEQRWLFVDWLRGDRILEIGPTRPPDGQPRLAALMEHAFDRENKERYRCEFDTARNDLPTRIVVLRDGDKIGIVLDIAYQEVIPGSAWFFKKATCRYFGPEFARSPDSDAWRQATTVETMGKVHVNEPIDTDVFAVKIPGDARVSDAVRSSIEKRGEGARPR
jgi:RNA polymerase sigma factor (sigma-70 family)